MERIPVNNDHTYIIGYGSSTTTIQLHKDDLIIYAEDGQLLAVEFKSKGSIQAPGEMEPREIAANSTVSFDEKGKPAYIVRKQ